MSIIRKTYWVELTKKTFEEFGKLSDMVYVLNPKIRLSLHDKMFVRMDHVSKKDWDVIRTRIFETMDGEVIVRDDIVRR